MRPSRPVMVFLALVLLLGVLPSPVSAAEPPMSDREMQDAFRFGWGSQAIMEKPGAKNDGDALFRAMISHELDAAKAELRRLEQEFTAAKSQYADPGEACEREAIDRAYRERRQRLRQNIAALRSIRGDKRGFFTKAWHKIGPAGRRIVRAFGDEALATLKSGGTLGGGVARHILIRAGRREVENVVLQGLTRRIRQQAAAAAAAAREECAEAQPGQTPATAAGAVPAIPAGTYEGAFDEAMLRQASWLDAAVIEVDTFELRIAEDGAISGGFEVRDSGELEGCAGAATSMAATIEPGQVIAPALPQTVAASFAYTLHDTVGYYSDPDISEVQTYCTDPQPVSDEDRLEFTIRAFSDGTISGEIADYATFELLLVP